MLRISLKSVHLLSILSLGLMLSQTTASAADLALSDGEKMKFRVSWGIFRHAGELTIEAEQIATDEESRLKITTTAASDGIVKAFYPFVATSEAFFDQESGLLLHANDVSETKKKTTRQTLALDYDKRVATYVNETEPDKSTEFEIPPGLPMDLITSLVQTRNWDLQPGDKQEALVLFDDEFYELTIHADRYEKRSTTWGKANTLVLVPKMDRTEPKGMFKRGSTVRVWVSQDEKRLPVRIEVKLKVGKGVMTLIEHQSPEADVENDTSEETLAAENQATSQPESS